MKKTVAEKWVNALRSKKYKQGRNALKMKNNKTGTVRHCCLGVLCELYQQDRRANHAKPLATKTALSKYVDVELPKNRTIYMFGESPADKDPACPLQLPKAVARWAGMGRECYSGELSEIVYFDGEPLRDLAGLNDAGCSFEEIANIIEDRVKEL
jgi:hypothetical protein